MTTTRREQIAAHEEELHILWRARTDCSSTSPSTA